MAAKQSPPLLLHPLGKPGRVGRELQLRPVDRDELRQVVERQHAFDEHDARGHDVDVAGHEGAQGFRHAGLDLEPDDRAAAAALERALVEPDEILGLLLDLDVAVANDAEGALPEHFVSGKQEPDEGDDQPVERDEARRRALRAVRQAHEALDADGNAHERAHRPAVLGVEELQRQGEA